MPRSKVTPLLIGCDMRLSLLDLETIDDAEVTDATVDYTITDLSDGTTFASGTLAVQGVTNDYWVTIDKAITADAVVGTRYKIVIEAEDDAGNEGTWVIYAYGAENTGGAI